MKKRWIGLAAILVGGLLILGAIGNSDLGADFNGCIVQAVIGLALVSAGVLWVRYIEAKYY